MKSLLMMIMLFKLNLPTKILNCSHRFSHQSSFKLKKKMEMNGQLKKVPILQLNVAMQHTPLHKLPQNKNMYFYHQTKDHTLKYLIFCHFHLNIVLT